ncbi:MAG: hypothetical protein HOP03_09435 [Lysobacter sp.]|nr:hypothetical protein [Lysobacter sp.]
MIHPKIEDGKALFPKVNDDGSRKVGQILHIGKIINHKGECVDSLTLEPQGIAHLISAECVHLPDEVCGLAHVLTRVCNDGLLTLNIGVVDPGWKNNLSTPVLNFSSERRLLQVGQPFIRLSFHQIQNAHDIESKRYINSPPQDYVREIRARAAGSFGKSFLNIKQLVGKASKKENARFKETMLKYLPIGAFSLAFFALMVTIGIATIARLSSNGTQAEAIKRLEEKVNDLERQKRAISPAETVLPQAQAKKKPGMGEQQ